MRRADLSRPGPHPLQGRPAGEARWLDERLDLLARAPERRARGLDRAADDVGHRGRALLELAAAQAQLALEAGAGLGDLALAATLEPRELLARGADGAVAAGELDEVRRELD